MDTPNKPDVTKAQRGAFIVFEGLDRSGKSTHAKNLATILNDKFNIPTQYRPFPDRTTETGKKINAFLQNQLDLSDKEIHTLFQENRIEVQQQLRDALNQGTTLIVDRYSYSGACFSAAKGVEGMDLKWCFEGESGLPAPDVVIFMSVTPEIAEKRGGYGEERYEKKEFQLQVRKQFERVIDMSPTWALYLDSIKSLAEKLHHNEQCDDSCNNHDDLVTLRSQKEQIVNEFYSLPENSQGYVTPWYKLSSDGDFEDVAKAVQFAATQVLNSKMDFPIHTMQQFPQFTVNNNKNEAEKDHFQF